MFDRLRVALLFFSRGALLRALTVAEDRFADDFSVGFSHPARDDGKQPQRLIVECEGDSARHSRQYYDINVKPIVLTLLLLAFGCKREAPVTATTDTRDPIEVAYVGAPESQVHAKANDNSRVETTFLNGESVSVLSRKGDWVEVRTAAGSGWAHAAELTNAANAKKEEDNPTPKFRTPPSPVVQPGAHGSIFIEANVNDQGEVTSTKVIVNETGLAALAAQNEAALKQARFYPIVKKGQRVPFVYDYNVTY